MVDNTQLQPIYVPDVPDEDTNTQQPLSLNTNPPPTTLSLDTRSVSNPSIPEPLAAQRAFKTYVGLHSVLDNTEDELRQRFMSGGEWEIRQQAAAALDLQKKLDNQTTIQDLAAKAANEGTSLDQDTVQTLLDPTLPANQTTDPATVLEKGWGYGYMNSLDSAALNMQHTVLDDAKQEIPKQEEDLRAISGSMIARREFFLNYAQNIQQQISAQSTVGYAADFAKQLVPFYNEVKLRGWLKDVSSVAGGFLGNNLEAQGSAYYGMADMTEMKNKATEVIESLRKDNPQAALQYTQAMAGMSSNEKILNNIYTPLDLLGAYDVGKLGVSAFRKASIYNKAQNTFKTAVKGSNVPVPTVGSMAEVAGDLDTAAVANASRTVVGSLDGTVTPSTVVLNPIPEAFNALRENITAAPGSLPRELQTRIEDQTTAAGNNATGILASTQRVERLPVAARLLSAIKDNIKDQFTGQENTILRIEDPLRNPFTNTRSVSVWLGDFDATAFRSEEQARNAAKMVHGLNDPKIVSEEVIHRSKLSESEQLELDRLADDGGPARQEGTEIEQKGLGYYIVVTKQVDETHPLIRNLALKDPRAESASNKNVPGWRSYVNGLVGKMRGADDTLAVFDSENRKIATFAQSNLQKSMIEEGKYIADVKKGISRFDIDGNQLPWYKAITTPFTGKLGIDGLPLKLKNSEIWDQFKQTLDYARKARDPLTKEEGYFFKDPLELQNHYMSTYQRLPSFEEVQGYEAFKRMSEYDLALRRISLYRNKARLGTEQHSWTMTVPGRDETGKFSQVKFNTPFVEGFVEKTLPSGEGSLLHITSDGKWKVYTEGSFQHLAEGLRDSIRNGNSKAIQIWNPEARPLKNVFDDAGNVARIRYVVSDTVDSKPMSMENQLDRRGGGHFEYDYSHYIKQARMRRERIGNSVRDWYEGDTTLMPIENGALGKDIVKHMEQVRQLLRDKKEAEAEIYANQHLPIKWKDNGHGVYDWFHESKGPGGETYAPKLSLSEPFRVIKNNETIYGIDKDLENRYKFLGKDGIERSTFQDGTKSGSAARAFQVKFTGERDADGLMTITDKGTKYHPLYAYEPANLTDPIPTMNRGLNRIISSLFMDDYKTFAVEHWLEENKAILRAEEPQLRASPFHYFQNADTDAAYKPNAPKNLVNNARNNLYKIQQFVGVPDKFDTQIHAVTQYLTDLAYEKLGPAGTRTLAQKAYTVVPLTMLNHIKDPVTVLRSFAFNAKLGLFALPQLLVQAQTWANIIALSPGHVAQGASGALFHAWTRFSKNPEVLAALDEKATALGWKPGVWREANEVYETTGFKNVAGEYAGWNNAFDKHFIANGVDTFLNLGQSFFRWGEASVRHGAWYTSFSEFRAANPIGKITEQDVKTILNRADLLYNNMSRASSSSLHTGVLSMSTQFLSYQLRLAELFVGKRISTMDKAKLFGTYAALYGIPSAFGLTGLPLGDYFRKAALDQGYNPGTNFWPTLAAEGIPSMMLALITGKGNYHAGNYYNVGDRYGAQGFTQIREALRSDTKWWQLVGGASASIAVNTIANADPAWKGLISLMKGDGKAFPMTLDDFLDIFNEFSSLSQAKKVLMAANTGKWMNKNEVFVDRASTADAIFMGATGLSHQAQDDMFTKSWTHQDEEDSWKTASKFAVKELQRGYGLLKDDPQGAVKHFTRAQTSMEIVGMPMEMRAHTMGVSAQLNESKIDQNNYSDAFKNVPTSTNILGGLITTDSDKRATRYQQYQDILNIKKQRGEL